MNVKQKLRKFFTLTRTADGGFTLVELIVVIAILAILAGVAVPAYNGYIKKARESADYQIIAAANTAFASACLESKIDVENVTDAAVSVIDQKVYGMSSVNAGTADTSKIASAFNRYYVGNEEAVFQTENVNSLQWNPDKDTFEMDATFVAATVTLSNGKTITISAEDMEKIQSSTYADMGYTGVALAINNVSESGESMAKMLNTIPSWLGGDKLRAKLTDVLVANGLTDATSAKNLTAEETGNGLQMVTAKYLAGASDDEIESLLDINLGGSSYSMVVPLATGEGGTRTVAAAAVQYALVSSFANSSAADGVKIGNQTVSEYLASADDPITAISKVQGLTEYKTKYVGTDQYNSDIDGFVGTMSLLGDNLGTTTNPGAVDIDSYFKDGVNSQDAKDVLTSVLGE